MIKDKRSLAMNINDINFSYYNRTTNMLTDNIAKNTSSVWPNLLEMIFHKIKELWRLPFWDGSLMLSTLFQIFAPSQQDCETQKWSGTIAEPFYLLFLHVVDWTKLVVMVTNVWFLKLCFCCLFSWDVILLNWPSIQHSRDTKLMMDWD